MIMSQPDACIIIVCIQCCSNHIPVLLHTVTGLLPCMQCIDPLLHEGTPYPWHEHLRASLPRVASPAHHAKQMLTFSTLRTFVCIPSVSPLLTKSGSFMKIWRMLSIKWDDCDRVVIAWTIGLTRSSQASCGCKTPFNCLVSLKGISSGTPNTCKETPTIVFLVEATGIFHLRMLCTWTWVDRTLCEYGWSYALATMCSPMLLSQRNTQSQSGPTRHLFQQQGSCASDDLQHRLCIQIYL